MQQGASYSDVRVVRRQDEQVTVKTGRVEGVSFGETEGFGVRVLVDGAWGFASSSKLNTLEADRIAALAVRIARASATALRDAVRLDERPPRWAATRPRSRRIRSASPSTARSRISSRRTA